MKSKVWYIGLCSFILSLMLLTAIGFNDAVTVISENIPPQRNTCFIIDPGHGGVDGGATSYSGVLESNINLEIALRLNDLMHLLGLDTCMIRTTDISVYTSGQTIAAKKVSDLKERVRIVNETENSVLVSIHQNYFTDSRYSGAQVFYGKDPAGKELAEALQKAFIQSLNPGSSRHIKSSEGIYLMQQVTCPAILIECGFLSNPEEDQKLQQPQYQKKLCCVIAAQLSSYANT